MTLTDEELDRNWKPSGRRPQSTIARSFSAELMDIFKIENSVADLDEQVYKRKHTVTLRNTELEALEARIREMEDRLKRSQGTPSRPPIPNYDQNSRNPAQENGTSQHEEPADKAKSRPGSSMTARPAPGSGNMPPTPVASEGEYDVVDRDDLDEVSRPRA